jgi:hypothetical protein
MAVVVILPFFPEPNSFQSPTDHREYLRSGAMVDTVSFYGLNEVSLSTYSKPASNTVTSLATSSPSQGRSCPGTQARAEGQAGAVPPGGLAEAWAE